ncbi:MAG TPA: Gfo/Idh/MocA family oxidoreductase [Nocardioides sp.]|nr:Gfo/Idh/MocA family oxidoreductase [Nocardioides sp.]
MTPLRIGLVGAGAHAAEVIVPTLMSTPGIQLAAICSRGSSAGELAAAWGVEGVQAEVEEFLKVGEFDAAVLCATPAAHEAALAVAPEYGVSLFVENPPAFGAAAIRRFAQDNAARPKPVTSFVDAHLRYAAMSRVALEHITAHGRVLHVAMDCHTDEPRTTVWNRDLLDSFLLSSGIQPLAVMAELLGWPAADTLTSAEVTQTRKDDIFVTADFTTRTTRGSLRMSNTRNRFAFETTVTCADGWSVSWTLDEVVVYRPGAPEEPRQTCSPLLFGGEKAGYSAAVREFRDACLGKAESRSTVEQNLVVMEWIERLRA